MRGLRQRLEFWLFFGLTWGLALLALYVHPAFWALFGFVLIFFITRALRTWK